MIDCWVLLHSHACVVVRWIIAVRLNRHQLVIPTTGLRQAVRLRKRRAARRLLLEALLLALRLRQEPVQTHACM